MRPTPGSQLALDVVFEYHAFVTDRDGSSAWLVPANSVWATSATSAPPSSQ